MNTFHCNSVNEMILCHPERVNWTLHDPHSVSLARNKKKTTHTLEESLIIV